MGFFSVKCPECGHPMLSEHASNSTNEWMQDCVLIPKDPELDPVRGQYDGYGRVAGDHIYAHRQAGDPWTACVYHAACWTLAGEPREWVEGADAHDQGFFFDHDHDHQKPNPLPNAPAEP